MTHRSENVEEFVRVFEKAQPSQYKHSSEMGIPQRYHLQCCFTDLWKKSDKTADWFEAHLDEIQPFIGEKRPALASYKSSPSERTLQMLRVAKNKVQQISRHCAHDFWLQLCNHIQVCADTGNLKGME